MKQKDYILECDEEICDGGFDCEHRSEPTKSQCNRCICSSCTRGECKGAKTKRLKISMGK